MCMKTEKGKLYVVYNEWIRDPETGEMPYKIGITQGTVADRYYGLDLKMPGEFVCEFAYEFSEHYADVEKTLHDLLSLQNVNGEWFTITNRILDAIQRVCRLAGGTLITKEVEEEIEKATGSELDPAFSGIITAWNAQSVLKTIGTAQRYKNIYLPGPKKGGPHYVFDFKKGAGEIGVKLVCWAQGYPDFDTFLRDFEAREMGGHVFHYIPPRGERYRGTISTSIPASDVNGVIAAMNSLIAATKDRVLTFKAAGDGE